MLFLQTHLTTVHGLAARKKSYLSWRTIRSWCIEQWEAQPSRNKTAGQTHFCPQYQVCTSCFFFSTKMPLQVIVVCVEATSNMANFVCFSWPVNDNLITGVFVPIGSIGPAFTPSHGYIHLRLCVRTWAFACRVCVCA